MIEDETFDSIDDALDITDRGAEIMKKEPASKPVKKVKSDKQDLTKDYEYSRAQLYSLVEKGQEAIQGALEVAQSTDHPRAYEVAGNLIKNVADIADKLLDTQKKLKDIEEEKPKGPSTVNNSVFVGSTAELQKILKQKMSDK